MKGNLRNILDQFRNKKIIVWGDLILDEYIYTSTGRVSREAPVIITEFESNELKLGGAGNVVMNIKSLGAIPVPVGLIGDDRDGVVLKEILKENSITTDYLVDLKYFKTSKKSRILSGGENTKKQQVLRIDTLNKSDVKKASYRRIEGSLLKLLRDIDLLIISDYLYESVNSDILKNIRKKFPSKKIIVDSRDNLLEFSNVTIITPNEPEIKKIFPDKKINSKEDFYLAGTKLLSRMDVEGIVLKRGHKGIIVFERNKNPEIIKIYGSSDIVDVTGAGDTVISVIGLSISGGADLFSSAKLANIAAGVVVMKEGAYPISVEELCNELC